MPPSTSGLHTRLARAWFPLTLVLLLFLALPGAVLFALTLFDAAGPINAWLEENLRLSYQLPLPAPVGLALLLVPIAIVLLYFLKLKRRPLQVPSTFLWKKSIEDLHVNSLFQWLRENVLLLLQVVAALTLLYALLGFRLHGASAAGKHYVLLLDNSASMATADVAPSRLEAAKEEALRVIDAHSDADIGMVIAFNNTAEILQSYTSDRALLRRAVQGVQQTRRPTRIEDALSLADSLANPKRSSENEAVRPADEEPGKSRTYVAAEGTPTDLHLFSDGRFPDLPEASLGLLALHYHRAGQPGAGAVDNVALVMLNAVREEGTVGRLRVLGRVLNYRPTRAAVRVRLTVETPGEAPRVYDRPEGGPLDLPPRSVTEPEPGQEATPVRDVPGEGRVEFELTGLDGRAEVVLHARLLDNRDSFPADDEAWLVVGVVRKARVLVVTPGNRILESFFRQDSVDRVARVDYRTPAELGDDARYRQPALAGAYDLVIFDRCAPEKAEELPRANTYFIDDLPPPWKRADLPPLDRPHVRGWDRRHPLLRDLTGLHEIGVTDAFRFDLQGLPRTPRLLESNRDAALLFAVDREAFTDLVQTFPLINRQGEWTTDWWRQPSFPLFLTNVLYQLGNVNDAAGRESTRPGMPRAVRPDSAVDRLEVEAPDGSREALTRGSRAEFTYSGAEEVGVYRTCWEGGNESFAVNLFDTEESNLQPRESIQLGAERVAAGEARSRPRDLWKWGAAAAFLLLLLEWYVYNRRVYI